MCLLAYNFLILSEKLWEVGSSWPICSTTYRVWGLIPKTPAFDIFTERSKPRSGDACCGIRFQSNLVTDINLYLFRLDRQERNQGKLKKTFYFTIKKVVFKTKYTITHGRRDTKLLGMFHEGVGAISWTMSSLHMWTIWKRAYSTGRSASSTDWSVDPAEKQQSPLCWRAETRGRQSVPTWRW